MECGALSDYLFSGVGVLRCPITCILVWVWCVVSLPTLWCGVRCLITYILVWVWCIVRSPTFWCGVWCIVGIHIFWCGGTALYDYLCFCVGMVRYLTADTLVWCVHCFLPLLTLKEGNACGGVIVSFCFRMVSVCVVSLEY